MFSMEKCAVRSDGTGTGTAEEYELFAGGGEKMGQGAAGSDDVASAVAAASDEIGDILKDELGDADRADRIGAELADLGTKLGILAGLADGDAQVDFASRFEVPFKWIALSGAADSGSSSSSWSGARAARRRPARPPRASRKRPIAKGKEMSRRRSIAARRAASLRLRRTEVQSDASDVGADTDSDDWTELDDESNMSDSSSSKEGATGDADCNGFQHKGAMDAPSMGQFLLPLFSAEPTEPEHFLIRHEDILQLLASAEESARDELLAGEDGADRAEALSSSDAYCDEEPPVTPEEEAALLHYVCETERVASTEKFEPIEEWLLGVYHSWCEISALMYTLIGTNMSVEMISQEWIYRARFGCHCRACLAAAAAPRALSRLLRRLVAALTHAGGSTLPIAMCIMRALKLGAIAEEGLSGDPALGDESDKNQVPSERWDLPRLRRLSVSAEGAAIIHEELTKLAEESDVARTIVHSVCLCRSYDKPFEKEYAFDRLCKILENFKLASTITFKVDMIPVGSSNPDTRSCLATCCARLARWLALHRRQGAARRLQRVRPVAPPPHTMNKWAGYKHRCDCLQPRTLCAEQRKQLLRISFFGMMQAVNEFNGSKSGTSAEAEKPPNEVQHEQTRELQQGDGTGAKPPDSPPQEESTQETAVQELITQETNSQELNTQDTSSQVLKTQVPIAQQTSSQEPNTQETISPELNTQETNIHELYTQETSSPELHTQGAISQELNTQDAGSQEVIAQKTDFQEMELGEAGSESGGGEIDDCSLTDSDANSDSLRLSTSSSLDSASELLMCAANATGESGGSEGEAPPGELCRTVRHLMKSIASIERLMDRVLKHCDEWPASNNRSDKEARKRVDEGLSEVDRKLMAMYRRLPEVHKRQLQVYRKQKKLSVVCMQLLGRCARTQPPPSPPRAPRPAHPPQPLQEVRRKVLHMRDQQLYYHRLRMWLEEQLRLERENLPEANVTLVEDLARRKRRTASPKMPRLTTAPKRKLKPVTTSISKPYKILQMLKHKAPAHTVELLKDLDNYKEDGYKSEADPPEAFPLDRDDNISDTDTIVGEKESSELCKEMKECLAKLASFDLNSPDNGLQEECNMQADPQVKYPESISPPLQETSPTTSEPMPVYTPKPSQRLLAVNKFLNRNSVELKNDKVIDFQSQIVPEINIPLNARRASLLVKEETKEDIKINPDNTDSVVEAAGKDPNIYKYVTFGLEIKKAMEECQNIINSYNSIKDKGDGKDIDGYISDGTPTLEQICEVMMNLDKNSDFIDKIDSDEPIDPNNTKLAELVENMPQILATMPEIASKLSEFANASFELPEFASIMNSLPDVNNEAQLTPETLKQIRELKLNKNRDNIKVTKNTARRKSNRRIKSSVDSNDIIGTMTFELDSKDISELLKDEKELQAIMRNKNSKEDFKDLLFSISNSNKLVIINKVFEYVKQNKNAELAKFLDEDKHLFTKPNINPEMYSKASTLFDNSVKDALSMDELRELVKSRFNSWKQYVATKFKSIPLELLDSEIEAMLNKFYSYIQDLAGKQCVSDSDTIIENIDELRKNKSAKDSDMENCVASKESLKPITKQMSTSAGNTFDLLIMKLSKISQDNKISVKGLKFKYMDVIRRCADSQQLVGWILLDPEIATNVIQELTGLPVKKSENLPDFTKMSNDSKRDYFTERLKEMNRSYMESLPKKSFTGDEWLVMLYRIEQLELKLKVAFTKVNPSPKPNTNQIKNASEAEILAAKGLSKIIGKANLRVVKKNDTNRTTSNNKNDTENKSEAKEKEDLNKKAKNDKNDALLAKCEAILTSKGEKSLLDSFYTIKSYITQGLPVPESYKKHVISICSTIDAKLLDDEAEDCKSNEKPEHDIEEKDKNPLSVIGSHNPELLAKYSAQALRNAKQTLNAVAFKNIARNGQSKSESDACDIPKSDCKYTNDCICNSCKDNALCSEKHEDGKRICADDKKKDKKPAVKQAKPPAKACENTNHQQHVCKVGHTNGTGACAGDAAADQPCTCCYCTVFGHAPPMTTPVPRNFNETRERLRLILNKKKQKCKTSNVEQEVQEKKPMAAVENAARIKPQVQAPLPQPTPPALPKTLPPTLSAQAQQKRQNDAAQQKQQQQLAEKMARACRVSVTPLNVAPPIQPRLASTQPSVVPTVKTEGKVNPNAMEQIRLQQLKLKQQQQAQYQQQLQQQQLQQQQQQQKKPEPIYDLPIHNKSTLTPQQQQIFLQQQQQQRQSRPQQQQRVDSLSRDTSVFSTSSTCDSESCWRGSREEDPRDLDALLQYIEGPARHVDRGKKRAKKQRQKAKKMESKLIEEHAALAEDLNRMRSELDALRGAHAAAKRRVDELRASLHQHHKGKKKAGKKQNKLSGAQAAKVQQMAEQLGELTTMLNTAAKEVQESEKQTNECSRRLAQCEKELNEARAMQGKIDRAHMQAAAMERRELQHQLQQQQLRLELLQLEETMDRQKRAAIMSATSHMPGGMVVVNNAGVQNHHAQAPLQQHGYDNMLNMCMMKQEECEELQQMKQQEDKQKKQTWEQALAHMNQLAKGKEKEKKKQKEQPKPEPRPKEPQRSQSLPDATQGLSKKQRKLLAKQQAEEEERRRLEEEAKSKKAAKKTEPAKADTKKGDRKTEAKKAEQNKKEEKKDSKKDKAEKKGKENKQEKNTQQVTAKQTKQPAQSKKEKKKEPQVINITPHTTIQPINDKVTCNHDHGDKPASCSIMEQLSCGVQVADLRLPPGITLTRVQPYEKKEPVSIKSVPAWKCNQLPAAPTPVARPPPVINAHPAMMMFSTAHPEQPKTIIVPEPPPQPPPATASKSKKAKKKAKKAAAAAAETETKADGTKMVTLRNPMFHPNMPPVQVSASQANTQPKSEIRIPDPIPMPPNACQATITPTSNGMYTIRNPLMSMMHQQSLMGVRTQSPQMNPMYAQQQYNYANPNVYNPVPNAQNQPYVLDPSRASPKSVEFQSRIMNLASFTQKNDEGYSLFKTSEDNQQRSFLTPEYFDNSSPKPTVSPNPIGTRPNNQENRAFDSNDSSLFANPIQRPEPIGTPLKREEETPSRSDYSSLYTPFGQEDRNVFRNALFSDRNDPSMGKMDDMMGNAMPNGDPLPYFQRLRVGSKLNNEVTIHHVTESKFYKGQDPTQPGAQPTEAEESVFSRGAWADSGYQPTMNTASGVSVTSSPGGSGSASPRDDRQRALTQQFTVHQQQTHPQTESSVFLPDRSITNLSSLEVSEREIESFKRFDFYFEPPQHKPKVQLDVRDIAAALRHNHK